MGKLRGFLETDRHLPPRRPKGERLGHYREFETKLAEPELRAQAGRCMDCGIPFCHGGCPLGNFIPDWNDHATHGRWEEAALRLEATNNFPEITGRICPAPCEEACTLNLDGQPVTIKHVEKSIADRAWAEGRYRPRPPAAESGRRVAIVGSGPAGLACAQQLRRAGHAVTVFERADRPGGLLRYGIPDFKLDRAVLDQRLAQMRAEGVQFKTGVHVGVDLSGADLRAAYDAVVLAGGATTPRDLPVPGRALEGVHFAMDFLEQQNRVNAGDAVEGQILATGKHVVILGGGDTGSDCLGTSLRQGAASVTQLELFPAPPEQRTEAMPWPWWPMVLRTSSSQEEGGVREWAVSTTRLEGDAAGRVHTLHAQRVEVQPGEGGRPALVPVEGGAVALRADLVLLAMGFTGPEPGGLLDQLGVERTERGNIAAGPDYATSAKGVYACGDARRGQSLVVWAIWEGREAARAVDLALVRATALPTLPDPLMAAP